MKLAATSDLSTGNCVPCLHSWYDTSTGKIIDTACNGGSYLSRTGTFTLASCAVGPARPSAAGGPPRLNVKALPTGPTHPGLASQRLQWANEALRALQAAPAGRNAKAKPTALSKAGRRRPTMVLADAAAGSAAGAAVSTSVTNTDVDAVRTHATYRHSTSEGSPWFRTLHNGDRAASLTTTEQVRAVRAPRSTPPARAPPSHPSFFPICPSLRSISTLFLLASLCFLAPI